MPQRCTVCDHDAREEIDRLLVAGRVSNRAIARQFSPLSKDAVARHSAEHLPDKLLRVREQAEFASVGDLIADIRALQERTLELLDAAESAGQLRTMAAAVREARGNLELEARLLGMVQTGPTLNILVSPAWQRVQRIIDDTLAPHPALRVAVARALLTVGNNG